MYYIDFVAIISGDKVPHYHVALLCVALAKEERRRELIRTSPQPGIDKMPQWST